MQILYSVTDESFKQSTYFPTKAELDKAVHFMDLIAGQNDFAAGTVLLSCEEEYAVHLNSTAFLSERGPIVTLRVAADFPLPVEVYHEQQIRAQDNTPYADALLPQDTVLHSAHHISALYVRIPTDDKVKPGSYTGSLRIYGSRMFETEALLGEIAISLTVAAVHVPSGKENSFYLDLWQHASNIARHSDVRLWSDAHFAVLENYLKVLGNLGQCALTVIVAEAPWCGQGCMNFPEDGNNIFEFSIVPVRKDRAGKLHCDFTQMQRYIDLAYKCGIRKEISLYGLINVWPLPGAQKMAPDYPDGVRIRYIDETTGAASFLSTAADIDEYIRQLEAYFIETKQIDRVRVAADEPGDVEAFRKSLDHLRHVAPSFKYKAAINHAEFIEEFSDSINDFAPYLEGCAIPKYRILQDYKKRMPGKRFLWYICCGPARPNNFLRSPLTESYLLGILNAALNMDGMLRWSFTVWTKDPRAAMTYNSWEAGDMYIVYPGNNGKPILSLRYYAFARGIQYNELLLKYRRRFGKARMLALLEKVLPTKDPTQYNKIYSSSYADYDELRRRLLTELAK